MLGQLTPYKPANGESSPVRKKLWENAEGEGLTEQDSEPDTTNVSLQEGGFNFTSCK